MTSHSSIRCGKLSRSMRLGAMSFLAVLSIPAGASAFSVDEIIEAANNGNGIVVESHSSASTGGQTAASGQTITTDDSSVSSHTETHINTGEGGGHIEVKVETTENGVTTHEEYSKPVEKNEAVHVDVEASGSETTVEVNGESQEAEVVAETEAGTSDVKEFFTETVPEFFKKAVSFFFGF